MTKKLLLALALLVSVSVFAQDQKFGYFNRAEIFQSMPETTAATKKLEQLSNQYKEDLTIIQNEYQKKGSDFMAAKDTLPESIKVRRMTEIQDLEQRLQESYQKSQEELDKARQDLITPINTKLQAAVKAIGQEQGFVYIFDVSVNGGLMYWSQDKCVDITNLLRAKLNLK